MQVQVEIKMYVCCLYGSFKEAANSSDVAQLNDGLISELKSCK
jgi:hypothetical protein